MKHRQALVERENWPLPLCAGAPGTAMKKASLCPIVALQVLYPGCRILTLYIVYHTQCHVPHALCAPYQALCSSNLVLRVYSDACSRYCVPCH